MDLGQSRRPDLLARAAALVSEDAGFARFLRAAVLATDGEDLGLVSPEQFEANLRRSYQHLLGFEGDGSR